jgi:DNA invertase Pin-like site-specific DNA recombinase
MAVYGYIRLDTDGNAFSVQPTDREAQVARIIEAASINGMVVDQFFTDTDDGLTPIHDRKGGAELLLAVKPGDVVVFSSVDRISQLEDRLFEATEALFKKKVSLIVPDVHHIPLEKGAMPVFRLQMIGMVTATQECAPPQLRQTGRKA